MKQVVKPLSKFRELSPLNVLIVPHSAERRTEIDTWDGGCDSDTYKTYDLAMPPMGNDLVCVMSALIRRKLKREDVYTFEPNIFRDTPNKPPGYRIVDDRTARGLYRAEHDCNEPASGRRRLPADAEVELWKQGKFEMVHATYCLMFELRIVGLGEVELAEFLEVTNH